MMETEIKTARDGYKVTELGEIPIEWDIATLGEVLKIGYGKNQRNVEVEKSDIPILGTGGIIGWSRTPLFEKPSVLIGRKGTIDKPMYIEKPFWTIDTLFYTDINIEKAIPKFIYYLFQTINWYKYNEATGVPSLSATNISKIKYSLPPISEQQKITEILSTVDEQIENTDQLIVKTKELKKGLMQQLLTKGIGHTEFKQTELGEIPVEWEVTLLDNVAERKSGHTPNKKIDSYWNGTIPWISLKDLFRLDKRYVSETTDYTTIEGINNSSAVLLPAETLVISRDATVGKIGITKEETATSQHFINYICSENLNNHFLYYYLSFKKPMFERIATGSTIKTIGLGFFKELKVVVPPIKEQQKIAEILSTVDDQIESYEQEKEKYVELKKGLMQQLLTGKIRVTV